MPYPTAPPVAKAIHRIGLAVMYAMLAAAGLIVTLRPELQTPLGITVGVWTMVAAVIAGACNISRRFRIEWAMGPFIISGLVLFAITAAGLDWMIATALALGLAAGLASRWASLLAALARARKLTTTENDTD